MRPQTLLQSQSLALHKPQKTSCNLTNTDVSISCSPLRLKPDAVFSFNMLFFIDFFVKIGQDYFYENRD